MVAAISYYFLFIRKVKYKVQFLNDGNIVEEVLAIKDELLSEPLVEDKFGYDIEGWYMDISDPNTKWNFSTDLVTSHLVLNIKWIIKDGYEFIDNIVIEDTLLKWDMIEGSTYEIIINDYKITSSLNFINLDNYKEKLLSNNSLVINFIKNDLISIPVKISFKYIEDSIRDLVSLDFEEITKGSYDEAILDFSDFKFNSVDSLLGASDYDLKNGIRSLRFKENGVFESIVGFENFYELSFFMGSYGSDKSAKLTLEYKLEETNDWTILKEFQSTNELIKHSVTKNDIKDLNDNSIIYFKFVKDSQVSKRVNVDDISIQEFTSAEYLIVKENDINLTPYYKSLEGLKGEELVNEMNFIISTNIKDIKYKDIKTILEFSDVDLNNKEQVIGIYNRVNYRANWGTKSLWHREHVWPNSKLGIDRVTENQVNQGSDPHNLRAINPSVNSSRSNRFYTLKNDPKESLGHTTITNGYYPGDLDVGDVARILMFMAVRYKDELRLTNNNDLLTGKAYDKSGAYMGKLELLNDWHELDEVDDFEVNRNNVIYEYQGNRNPFIDHPELFKEVFNYFTMLDLNRLINIDLVINMDIDYYDFKKSSLLS